MICTHVHIHMGICACKGCRCGGLRLTPKGLPLSLIHLILHGRVFKSSPQFEDVVRLTSQLALGMPCLWQLGLLVCPASVWILGI